MGVLIFLTEHLKYRLFATPGPDHMFNRDLRGATETMRWRFTSVRFFWLKPMTNVVFSLMLSHPESPVFRRGHAAQIYFYRCVRVRVRVTSVLLSLKGSWEHSVAHMQELLSTNLFRAKTGPGTVVPCMGVCEQHFVALSNSISPLRKHQ